jgi:hypothetical protein
MPTPPSTGPVTSPYGPRKLNIPGVGSFHYGADRAGKGNVAPESGVIVFAGYSGVFGNIILVRAGDVVWNIAHCANLNGRRAGQRVTEAEYLAPLGATGLASGPHSHTERRVGGRDAIQSGTHTDPERYYTAPSPSGGGARPFGGFLMALSDTQQQQIYDIIVGNQQLAHANVIANAVLNKTVERKGRMKGSTSLAANLAWSDENIEATRDLLRALAGGNDVGDVDVDRLAGLLSKSLGASVAADLARRLQS